MCDFAAALCLRRDFEDGVVVIPETVRKVFYSFRPDAAQKVLFEQFMPFAEKLGVSFRSVCKSIRQTGGKSSDCRLGIMKKDKLK